SDPRAPDRRRQRCPSAAVHGAPLRRLHPAAAAGQARHLSPVVRTLRGAGAGSAGRHALPPSLAQSAAASARAAQPRRAAQAPEAPRRRSGLMLVWLIFVVLAAVVVGL